ncbi:hypothetical protein D6C20_24450 [Escherichia coli]|nr:hypothetical protein [Escherichia coli]
MTQHIVSSAAESGTTCCAYRRWRCVGGEEDPELPFFGSRERKRGIFAAWTQKTSNCCDERIIAP